MAGIKYTKTHQWVKEEKGVYTAGITEYAQEQLGNIIFVSLPSAGQNFKQQDEAAVVESMKVASEVYMPVSGEITAINEALGTEPSLVNSDPEGKGWFFKIKPSRPQEMDELMSLEQYRKMVQS